jgi:hypothetical protein
MHDRAREPHFVCEPLQTIGATGHRLRHELQCDGLSDPQIVGAVHFAHRATSEQTNDAVARREDASGRKPRVIQRPEV